MCKHLWTKGVHVWQGGSWHCIRQGCKLRKGTACGRAVEGEGTPLLEEVASYSLAGRTESLAVLKSRVPGLQRDALLLTFRRAPQVSGVAALQGGGGPSQASMLTSSCSHVPLLHPMD